jgi:hypothetical protein
MAVVRDSFELKNGKLTAAKGPLIVKTGQPAIAFARAGAGGR